VSAAQRAAEEAMKLSESQNWPAAARAWQRAADRTALLNDRAGEAVALHNLALAKKELGAVQEAHELLEQASRLNAAVGRRQEWWRNQIALLQTEALLGDRAALEQRFQEIAGQAAELRDASTRALFLNERALWEQGRGEFERAGETFRQAQELFESGRDAAGLATVLANRARLLEAQGNHAAAASAWEEALAKFEALGNTRGIAHALAGRGHALLAARQDLPAAEDLLRRAVRNFATLGQPRERQKTLDLLVECLRQQGKPEEAERIKAQPGPATSGP
jgi:tetratricopeptide (TPR) repeat protein